MIYPILDGIPREHSLDWRWPSGASLGFAGLEYDKSVYDYQGSQICFMGFDELTHFSKNQFFYMLSRNRSTCGVKPYVRATCNPDATHWLRPFIDWWIGEDGQPIQERSGVIRWFVRLNDEVHWGETRQELVDRFGPETEPKSFTFVAAKISDNQILMAKDPGYLANLQALPKVERDRLLGGNWNVIANAGIYFKRSYFQVVDAVPSGCRTVRAWDLAATKDGGDWTVGLKLSYGDRTYYIEHIERFQGSAQEVESAIRTLATSDGQQTIIGLPQDPGQAGKAQAAYLVAQMPGYVIKVERETGNKATRALPASSQAEVGNIKLIRGKWNEAFLNEAENFDGHEGGQDDMVDALSRAVNLFTKRELIVY